MSAETLLRLALVPTAVWLASLAARRWGHAASGFLGGLPLIGGPITFFLASDLGNDFAARSAAFTLAATAGQAAHLLAFAFVGRRTRSWWQALGCGWASFVAVALAVTALPLHPAVAYALALSALAAAWRWLPRYGAGGGLPSVPALELRLRLGAAFVLAALILWAAPVFGSRASGILLSLPVTGSIMPPFTLALYGNDALARLLRGFVVGLSGFSTFFFVVAAAVQPWGAPAAFGLAVPAAIGAVFAVSRIARRAPRP